MSINDPFVCPKCQGHTEYHGRISAPAHMIYKCTSCEYEHWVKGSVQQQQQPQPKKPPR
jgi:ribosomal protein L37AE/L43A